MGVRERETEREREREKTSEEIRAVDGANETERQGEGLQR